MALVMGVIAIVVSLAFAFGLAFAQQTKWGSNGLEFDAPGVRTWFSIAGAATIFTVTLALQM